MQVDTKIPATSQEILKEADKLGFKYKFIPSYDIEQLDPDKRRVQVRMENVAPSQNVQSFMNHMKAGVVFPPLLLSLDGFVIDANTRVKAAKKLKLSTFPAIVIQANYEGARDDVRQKFHVLAATANQKGAQRLKPKEAVKAAADAMLLGLNNKRIQETIGVSANVVNRLRRLESARVRLHRMGMAPETLDILDILGANDLVALNNEPFKRLTFLVKDAGLTSREASEIARRLKKDGSDEAAIESLKQYRAEMEGRIRDHALTGNGKPSMAARFRAAIGNVLAFEAKSADVVERTGGLALAQTHLDRLDQALDYIEGVRTAQTVIVDRLKAEVPMPVEQDGGDDEEV
jgi:hypothetical protein